MCFVVFRRGIFSYLIRRTIQEACEEHFHVFHKQKAALDMWPIQEPLGESQSDGKSLWLTVPVKLRSTIGTPRVSQAF